CFKRHSNVLTNPVLSPFSGKREVHLKNIGLSQFDDLFPRLNRCKANRQTVRECADHLKTKAELSYKIDPTLKHASSL
ncbi:unnamed protein product, partial [Hymenolepis diminuta]